ncbi:hypothetical protein GCM10011380_27110 [Sphingomonas metalli]|uniref:Uncharacterized protein n=1 Tax=Sphingomonas metalli TaxID=1779358 RepID=A0A916WWN8_9SPHN|nr:hypothetical protein GCM10011380_27110 [Sphingomonas metalli]
MKRAALITLAVACAATPAVGQTLKPLAEARLRWEHVDQGGLPDAADAVTVRLRTGLSLEAGRWSALAEAQGNLAIVGDYFDGVHPDARRPLIGDPQSIGLYRAQVQYRAPGITLTGGRQRLILEDERFVGAAAIRNNGQSFDAVRAEVAPIKGVKADIT